MKEDTQNIIESLLPEVKEHRKIGIFGGSFNPPHLGHAMMVLTVLMTQDIDEVWILPTASHAEKEGLMPFGDRMEMCKHTFGHIQGVKVIPMESFMPSPNYTLNTVKTLKTLRPEIDLYFMIGSDLVEEVPHWTRSEGLTDFCTFLIVPRQGHPLVELPEELGTPVEVDLSISLPEVSSTLIGKLKKRGASVKGFLEKRVNDLLEQL